MSGRLGPEARALLDAAREADDPTDADRARVRRAVVAAIAASAGASAVASAGSAAASAAGGGASATAAGTATATATSAAVGTPALAGAGAAAIVKVVAVLAVAATVTAIAVTAATPHDGPDATAVPGDRAPATSAPASVIVMRSRERPAGTEDVAPGPIAAPVAPPVETDRPVAPEPARAARSTPRLSPIATRSAGEDAPVAGPAPEVAPATLRVEPPPAPAMPRLAEEVALLGRAQAALRDGAAPRALALLDEHAARFPEGALRQERAATRVLALCAIGRPDEASVEARSFLASSPASPLAARVRASCAF